MSAIPSAILEPIREGLANRAGGEVVVRARDSVGHVYLFGGGIAWVTCDTVTRRLRDVLQEEVGIEGETLDAVVAESKAKRTHFGETLLAWGLTTRDALRGTLLRHNVRNFAGILELPGPVAAMFIPQKRTYSSDLLFSLTEILGAFAQPTPRPVTVVAPAPAVPARLDVALSALAATVTGCRALLAFDPAEHRVLGSWSPPDQPVDPLELLPASEAVDPGAPIARLVSSQSGLFSTPSPVPQHPREVLSVSSDSIHVVSRSASAHLGLVLLCGTVGGPGLAIATSRRLMAELERQLAGLTDVKHESVSH